MCSVYRSYTQYSTIYIIPNKFHNLRVQLKNKSFDAQALFTDNLLLRSEMYIYQINFIQNIHRIT